MRTDASYQETLSFYARTGVQELQTSERRYRHHEQSKVQTCSSCRHNGSVLCVTTRKQGKKKTQAQRNDECDLSFRQIRWKTDWNSCTCYGLAERSCTSHIDLRSKSKYNRTAHQRVDTDECSCFHRRRIHMAVQNLQESSNDQSQCERQRRTICFLMRTMVEERSSQSGK